MAKSSPKSPAAKRTTASGTTSAAEATPNRAAEDPWTDAELAGIRQQLAADIEALNAEITQAAEHLDQLEVGPAGTSGDDPVDSGARAYDRENELSLVRNARQMIQQCEEAVARLDDGSYGTCASCGEPIPKLRLQAFPRASLCIACKQRSERH
ncbi:MAG: hypothetical protein CSB46_09515 [Micrococcales bacterium]|nr:MAG: hypothetical protein CSB46_09515 [Micrococcales bacterium]